MNAIDPDEASLDPLSAGLQCRMTTTDVGEITVRDVVSEADHPTKYLLIYMLIGQVEDSGKK
jgi:hypothetical protein